MNQTQWIEIAVAIACIAVASLLAAADSAFSSMSKSRAEGLLEEGRTGAKRLVDMVADPAPFLNTALFLRLLVEVTATDRKSVV